MALAEKKIETYTFADLLEWDEGERYELIDGEAVLLASPRRVHQEVSGELFAQLHRYLQGKTCRITVQGKRLAIEYYTGDDILISGLIHSVATEC